MFINCGYSLLLLAMPFAPLRAINSGKADGKQIVKAFERAFKYKLGDFYCTHIEICSRGARKKGQIFGWNPLISCPKEPKRECQALFWGKDNRGHGCHALIGRPAPTCYNVLLTVGFVMGNGTLTGAFLWKGRKKKRGDISLDLPALPTA
ncbi:MAG: hypothetical protein RIM83_05275 [Allomuricauda sp.]